jgi:ferrous iron transport protein A
MLLADNDVTMGLVSLADLREGARARVCEIRGGRHLELRLLGLGLRVGMEVSVVQRRRHGVVVASAGSRIALGAGVADNLIVMALK